jgi:hypothetical protein
LIIPGAFWAFGFEDQYLEKQEDLLTLQPSIRQLCLFGWLSTGHDTNGSGGPTKVRSFKDGTYPQGFQMSVDRREGRGNPVPLFFFLDR